ncbi:MAG UNVERIFIED_CONTAM: hypothetical protein LVR18_06065 [Planctomycetaceae bacterium]
MKTEVNSLQPNTGSCHSSIPHHPVLRPMCWHSSDALKHRNHAPMKHWNRVSGNQLRRCQIHQQPSAIHFQRETPMNCRETFSGPARFRCMTLLVELFRNM